MPTLHTATGVLHPLRVTVPRQERNYTGSPKQSSHRSICTGKGLWPALSGVSLARASAFAGISRLPARFDFQAL